MGAAGCVDEGEDRCGCLGEKDEGAESRGVQEEGFEGQDCEGDGARGVNLCIVYVCMTAAGSSEESESRYSQA